MRISPIEKAAMYRRVFPALRTMSLKRFTVLGDMELQFSDKLNVIIGENGVGKTHLLKLAYSLIAPSEEAGRKGLASSPTKAHLQKAYADKLGAVFQPDSLGRLVSRKQGRERCEIALKFADERLDTAISFATNAKTEVQLDQVPESWCEKNPVYLPTRELLTIYRGFVSLYEGRYTEFEETWRDTCLHLGNLLLKGESLTGANSLIASIETVLGGKVVLEENGRFYLKLPSGNMEMSLLAEGHRKLAMLARLIANGSIASGGYLFWDEPEANLNPRLIKFAAQMIYALAASGVQVFIATHSLFLLRELEILQADKSQTPCPMRFFGLHRTDEGVRVEQGDHIDDIGEIVALEERLKQSDRYLAMGN